MQDIFPKPQFYIDDASASDVRQGRNGDCWFLSALCAISNKKNLIDRVCVARDEVVGVYGFVFHRDGEWYHTVIDDKLYLTAPDWWEARPSEKENFENTNNPPDAERTYRETLQRGSRALYFAQSREDNETWLPLLEKAFAKAHGDYSAIEGGWTGEAIEDLTGGVTTELFATDILDKEQFWRDEILNVNDKFLFSCATGHYDSWQGCGRDSNARSGIVSSHAYSIMDAVEKKGHRLLKVRNPWGTDEWRGAWSDGSEQWTPEWMHELNHKFGDDGMFWISYEDLLDKFSFFERTRLFDPSWIVAQQWTTVDVPYSADYNDIKFQMTITRKGPVVIVLSQLDGRYFKGMEGKYTFELHFRLDKEGEDDYIVRSHGNYSMTRSVSTDLPELEPGTYSVLMRITAHRFWDMGVPEKAIRKAANTRPKKLIQIGLSYDLAYAKGEIKETEEEKDERSKLEEKKKADEKKKKRKELSEAQKKKWEYGKRDKAREKRRKQKREAYQRKQAQKLKTTETADGGGEPTPTDEGATVAAGVEGEVERQAAAGAEQDKKGGSTTTAADLPSPPAEPDAEPKAKPKAIPEDIPTVNGEPKEASQTTNEVDKKSANDASDSLAAKAEKFKKDLQSIPSVTVNGEPAVEAAAGSALAPPSIPPSGGSEDDDYLYDSDASFHSSIDSVLDFPSDETPATADTPAVGDDEDDSDVEFTSDPWNAVCVVGLRVFSKDEGCAIKVIRPRTQEESVLEVDDVSKGVSGEKPVAKSEEQIETEVKTGVS